MDLPYIRTQVQLFVDRYEPEYLKGVLGNDLYHAFIAGLQEDPIPVKWLQLRDGASFLVEHSCKGATMQWDGFLGASSGSPIAAYIYYWFLRKRAAPSTGMGNVLPRVENGIRSSYVNDMSLAWNTMACKNRVLYLFLDKNKVIYNWNARNIDKGWYESINPLNI